MFDVVCGGFIGGLQWFGVVCGGLWWFAVVCGNSMVPFYLVYTRSIINEHVADEKRHFVLVRSSRCRTSAFKNRCGE